MEPSESTKGTLGCLGIVAFVALITWLFGPLIENYTLAALMGMVIAALVVVVIDPRRQAS